MAACAQRRMLNTSKCCLRKVVAVSEAKRFMIDCLQAVQVPAANADNMASMLVEADHRRIFSHGMNRLAHYVNDLTYKVTDGAATPKILSESPATAWVDGGNGLGPVVGTFCMKKAIEKAKEVGVGWVCAGHSNHFGFTGWYTEMAMKENLVGLAMSNSSPLMVPTNGKEPALGTNPIAMSAAVSKNDYFSLDIATTVVALGTIEMHKRKNEPLVMGWAMDKDGNVTTDPVKAYEARALLPLGGLAITSGYKGYGLGALVDIFSGVMSGALYSKHIRNWKSDGSVTAADLGHLLVALNPKVFAPDFEKRLENFLCILRNTKPINEKFPVLVPGDIEKRNIELSDKEGGIVYIENQLKTCCELAEKLNVKPLCFL